MVQLQHAVPCEAEQVKLQSKPFSGARRTWLFATAGMNMIDFAAIAPYYVELAAGGGGGGMAFLRVLRLARILRVFKLAKYSQSLQLFAKVR